MKLYFAHPFHQRVKNRCLELDLEGSIGIELFNPFYDDDTRKSDTKTLDDKHAYNRPSYMDMDSTTDRECEMYVDNVVANMCSCDGVLASPEGGGHTVPFLIMLAHTLDKKVYVVSEEFKDCPWFRVYSACVFHSWSAFKTFFEALH